MIALVGLFVVGIALGILGGFFIFDGDSDSEPAEAQIDCEESRAVVDLSGDTIEEINQTETQDATFFVAILIEQRTITYAMEDQPTCFTLQERAAAQGLLSGLEVLLQTPINPVATTSDGTSEE